MKIVIDTNVIISAIFFKGQPFKLLEYLFKDEILAFVSPKIVQEYIETYNEVHKKYADKGNPEVLQKIIEKSNLVFPEKEVKICRDPDDDKFISCALQGKCVYIVSGDNDLLSLGKVQNVEIIKVGDFFARLSTNN